MSVMTKWGLACVLVPVWLIFEYYLLDTPIPKEPLHVIELVPNEVVEQQLAHGLVLWRDKKYQQASQAFSLLESQNLSAKLKPLADLYQYHATAFTKNRNANFAEQLSNLADDCKQKLLFVTSDIGSLAQAAHFRSRFAQDTRLSSLSICIYDVTWFDPIDIVCEENWQQSGRLGCQLLSLAEKLKILPFTHLVMFAEKGKANVHNGIMFLDRQDTYDVFIHELAHFSGFIDEYPLSQGLAKRVCAGVDAPNIVFKQAGKLAVDRQYWQSIGIQNSTPIFAARTCDNHGTQAFKSSSQLTFMEYHDTAYIPPHYLTAWQRQLQVTPNQPSAHVKFAQLYEQSHNLAESLFWQAKYQQYLSGNINRASNL
jgi:hypothetical protein